MPLLVIMDDLVDCGADERVVQSSCMPFIGDYWCQLTPIFIVWSVVKSCCSLMDVAGIGLCLVWCSRCSLACCNRTLSSGTRGCIMKIVWISGYDVRSLTLILTLILERILSCRAVWIWTFTSWTLNRRNSKNIRQECVGNSEVLDHYQLCIPSMVQRILTVVTCFTVTISRLL